MPDRLLDTSSSRCVETSLLVVPQCRHAHRQLVLAVCLNKPCRRSRPICRHQHAAKAYKVSRPGPYSRRRYMQPMLIWATPSSCQAKEGRSVEEQQEQEWPAT